MTEERNRRPLGEKDNEMIDKFIDEINSNDKSLQAHGISEIACVLSTQESIQLKPEAESKLLSGLLLIIQMTDDVALQSQSVCLLAQLTMDSVTQDEILIQKNAIPLLIALLKSEDTEIVDSAVMALANLSADSTIFRGLIIENFGYPILLETFLNSQSAETYKHTIKVIANLTKEELQLSFQQFYAISEILCKMLKKETDPEIIADIISALSCLTSSDEARVDTLVHKGILPVLVKHLNNKLPIILVPTLKIIGDIISASDKQADIVLSHDLMPICVTLLNHEDLVVRRDTCLVLGNLTSRSSLQIQYFVDNSELRDKVMLLAVGDAILVRRQAVTVLTNYLINASLPQKELLYKPIFDIFCQVLHPSFEIIALAILESILYFVQNDEGIKAAYGCNMFLAYFMGIGGLEKIGQYLNHPNESASRIVTTIYEFFNKA